MTVIMCQDVPTHVYDDRDVITLPVKRQFERVEMTPQVIFCLSFSVSLHKLLIIKFLVLYKMDKA